MKYCSKCGAELYDDAVICVKCGCPVENNIQFSPQAPTYAQSGTPFPPQSPTYAQNTNTFAPQPLCPVQKKRRYHSCQGFFDPRYGFNGSLYILHRSCVVLANDTFLFWKGQARGTDRHGV